MKILARSLLFSLCVASVHAAPAFRNVPFPLNAPPEGCTTISGVFPLNDRVSHLWGYERYAVVMPPYIRKKAQSFDCGGQRGTLFFFEYANATKKDKAVLFAKPVVSQASPAPEFQEWANGFVLISFAPVPTGLEKALHARLSGEPPATPPAVTNVSPNVKPVDPVNSDESIKPMASVAKKVEPANPIEPAKPVASAAINNMIVHGPSMAADPFAPNGQPSLTAPKPVPPPLARVVTPKLVIVSRPAYVPPPVLVVPPPIVVPPPVVALPLPSVQAPIAPPPSSVIALASGGPDLASSLLESFALKIGCDNPQRPAEMIEVCTLMREFASALPPVLPFENGIPRVGPIFTMDSYGRITDLHTNALVGTELPGVVAFFTLEAMSGTDDFEIKSLIEARKTKAALPANGMVSRMKDLARRKRFPLVGTDGRSLVFQPVADRRVYIRRTATRLILIGTFGTTVDAQTRSSLIVCAMY